MRTCASKATLLLSAGRRGAMEPWCLEYHRARSVAESSGGPMTGVCVVTAAWAVLVRARAGTSATKSARTAAVRRRGRGKLIARIDRPHASTLEPAATGREERAT